jgi:malonate transporter and related proteins
MSVLLRLASLLALLVAGAGLRMGGVLDDGRADWLNDAAYYVALPALIFVSTYSRSVGEILSPALVVGVFVVFFGTAVVAFVVHRRHDASARRSVATVQSYHSNLGYLGVPLVAATFDDHVTAIASAILGMVSLVQIPLTVFVLSTINGADTTIRDELRRILTTPVLLALVAGLGVGSLGIPVPGAVAGGLDLVGQFALPLALLCVGSSLEIDLPAVDYGAVAGVVGLKILLMPALAWAVFSTLHADTATFTAGVVMFATPTAVSTFVFANELGGDEAFASLNVFLTTLVSMGSLFVFLTVLG